MFYSNEHALYDEYWWAHNANASELQDVQAVGLQIQFWGSFSLKYVNMC